MHRHKKNQQRTRLLEYNEDDVQATRALTFDRLAG